MCSTFVLHMRSMVRFSLGTTGPLAGQPQSEPKRPVMAGERLLSVREPSSLCLPV
jgi:hypothetical protein